MVKKVVNVPGEFQFQKWQTKWKNLTMGWFRNSGSILGNSVIPTDLPIWATEHQEFVSFSAFPAPAPNSQPPVQQLNSDWICTQCREMESLAQISR